MPGQAASDEEIMRRVRDGRTEAFSIVVRRHAQNLMNLVYRMVWDYHIAEDLVQETFVAAFRARNTFRAPGNLWAWLRTIAVNKTRDYLRRSPRELSAPSDLDGFPAQVTDASNCENSEGVRAAVSALPREQAEVVIMRVYGGLNFKEIASTVGCAEATAKSRMRYALQKMRRILLQKGDER